MSPDYPSTMAVGVEDPPRWLLAACIECEAVLLVQESRVVVVPDDQYGGVITVKDGAHAGKAARCPYHGDQGFPLRHVTRDEVDSAG